MHNKIIIFIVTLLIATIVYGGSGVNMYFYCCNDCRTEGTAAITEQKCCEVHHHHLGGLITHYSSDVSCAQQISTHPDACGVERILVNWDSYTASINRFQPLITNLEHPLFQIVDDGGNYSETLVQEINRFDSSQKPPNLSQSDYFTTLSTLII
jgi:hypothetical protein